jgi:hypothetical protein
LAPALILPAVSNPGGAVQVLTASRQLIASR